MDAALGAPGKLPAHGTPEPIDIICADGQLLSGHVFEPTPGEGQQPGTVQDRGSVVIACATGVKARYYHRYAAFLAEHGFTALTFDYRGIGASAPADLRGFRARWHEWGTQDIDAAVRWARKNLPEAPVSFVGHSFGGFGVALAPEAQHLDRILTIGAQHAYWRDYAKGHRAKFLTRWHLLMPLWTRASGYFPGKRRGLLEDLPRGVALDWARSRKDFTTNAPAGQRQAMRATGIALRTPILALAATDDPYATAGALERALAYTPHSPAVVHRLEPRTYGKDDIGHFGLFHSDHADNFWPQTLAWLRDGVDDWAVIHATVDDQRFGHESSPGRSPAGEGSSARGM